MSWLSQFRALARKNALVVVAGKPLLTFFALLLPAVFAAVLARLGSSAVITLGDSPGFLAGRTQLASGFPLSLNPAAGTATSAGSDTPRILFTPSGDPTVLAIMKTFASSSGLVFGSDVLPFDSELDASAYIIGHASKLSYSSVPARSGKSPGVDWGLVQFMPGNGSSPGNLPYTIWSRNFGGTNFPDRFALAVQVAVDSAVLSYSAHGGAVTSSSTPALSVAWDWFKPGGDPANDGLTTSVYADATLQGKDFDVISMVTAPLLSISFIPLMTLAVVIVAEEKNAKLFGVLVRMGLLDSAFWTALIFPLVAVGLIGSALTAGAAKLASSDAIPLFHSTTFEVLFIINLCFSLSVIGFGCIVASIFSRPVQVSSALGLISAVAFFLNFAIFATFTSATDVSLPMLGTPFFKSCQEVYAKILLFLFAPFEAYAKAINDIRLITEPTLINNNTGHVFDLNSFLNPNRTVVFPSNQIHDAFVDKMGGINPASAYLNRYYALDTTATTTFLMIVQFLLYVCVAWYLNQVLPSGDGGVGEGFSRSWYFPFTWGYWKGQSVQSNRRRKSDEQLSNAAELGTLEAERERSKAAGSVRMVKLSKTYRAGVTAVKEFTGVFEKGRVHAVLGHNGAGKTTLINMLSLVTLPTNGECFIQGLDVREDTGPLLRRMALCAQSDVLYPSLTAYEHVKFYLTFRYGRSENLHETILAKLAAVDLAEVAHKVVGGFSGGMKRRMSLCLATLVDEADIVFLDEPTTGRGTFLVFVKNAHRLIQLYASHFAGLDPLSRRKVWDVIQKLKTNRVVVLTTHSMEEADALGDSIYIMHQGRLRASGSSIFLKARFGRGFQISVASKGVAPTRSVAVAAEPEMLDERDKKQRKPAALGWAIPSYNRGKKSEGQPQVIESGADFDSTATAETHSERSNLISYLAYALPDADLVASSSSASNSSSSSAFVTVAVGREQGAQIAALLSALREDETLDWSISNSTLEEVFLKICAENKNVVSDSEASPNPDGQRKARKACILCGIRPTAPVTLYTKGGNAISIPDVVCHVCAELEDDAVTPKATAEDSFLISGHRNPSKTEGLPSTATKTFKPMTFSEYSRFSQNSYSSEETVATHENSGGRNDLISSVNADGVVRIPVLSDQKDGPVSATESRKSNSGGGQWGRFLFQAKAIFVKNFVLMVKERKTNVGSALFILAVIVVASVVKPTPSNPSGFSKASAECTDVIFFSNGGYTCQPADLAQILKTRNPSPCETPSDPNSSSGSDEICAGGSYKPFTSRGSLKNIGYQSSSRFTTTDGSAFSAYLAGTNQSIAVFAEGQTTESSLKFSSLLSPNNTQLLPLSPWNPPQLLFQNVPRSNISFTSVEALTAGSVLPNVPKADASSSIVSTFSDFQRVLKQSAVLLSSTSCGPGNGTSNSHSDIPADRTGVVVSTIEEFAALWRQVYPDLGLQVNKLALAADGSNVEVDYDIVSYPIWEPRQPFVPIYLSNATIAKSLSTLFGGTIPPTPNPGTCWVFQPLYSTRNSIGYSRGMINSISNAVLEKIVKARGAAATGNETRTVQSVTVMTAYLPSFDLSAAVTGSDQSHLLMRSLEFIFLLLGTSVLMPRVVTLLVLEKRENLVELMKIQGLSLARYWLGNYIFAFSLITAVNIVFIIVAVGGGSCNVADLGVGVAIVLMLLWTHAQISMAVLISSLLQKPVVAALVSYLIFLLSSVFGPFIITSADTTTGSLGYATYVFPPIGFLNVMNMILSSASGIQIFGNTIVWVLFSTIWLLLGCYIHAIRPSPVGIPMDPFFGLFGSRKSSNKNVAETAQSSDPDVEQEILQVEQSLSQLHDPEEAVRIAHLRKEFPRTKKVAVHDVSLSLRYGETFGLLGPNGAGKTTLLSMVTGLMESSNGSIFIDGDEVGKKTGLSVNRSTDASHLIGITPQFDLVWPDLTVEEHLSFFCRLAAGTQPIRSRRDLATVVRRIAEDVELAGDAFKTRASALSGGMRRRLAIGISLCGDPRILVLDEPSTGLDPEAKRGVWRIVENLKRTGGAEDAARRKLIVITTHSMEEADALCSRIGIVCDGRIKALGSQIHLKKKYGDGLKLTLRFSVSTPPLDENPVLATFQSAESKRLNSINSAIDAVMQQSARTAVSAAAVHLDTTSDMQFAFADASVSNRVARGSESATPTWMVTVRYLVDRDALDISKVFLGVEKVCRELDVAVWALNETTLEDVFVRVVEGGGGSGADNTGGKQ
ncbi:hypothetical protein DFJ73DRAFT_903716 [Zopfochytrium polystomum]|nr:hypothetical protein DFJ73DRAFT_903716 [Zopfochytrium polystomum]